MTQGVIFEAHPLAFMMMPGKDEITRIQAQGLPLRVIMNLIIGW